MTLPWHDHYVVMDTCRLAIGCSSRTQHLHDRYHIHSLRVYDLDARAVPFLPFPFLVCILFIGDSKWRYENTPLLVGKRFFFFSLFLFQKSGQKLQTTQGWSALDWSHVSSSGEWLWHNFVQPGVFNFLSCCARYHHPMHWSTPGRIYNLNLLTSVRHSEPLQVGLMVKRVYSHLCKQPLTDLVLQFRVVFFLPFFHIVDINHQKAKPNTAAAIVLGFRV